MANCDLLQNPWVRLVISVLVFIAILVIDLTTREQLYNWSVKEIPVLESNTGDWLKFICNMLYTLGGQIPNLIVIIVFTAMFKRRH